MRNSLIILFLFVCMNTFSQTNPLTYSLNFLDLNTNARIAGFGEVGVVGSPYYNDGVLYQNPALISEQPKVLGINNTIKSVADIKLGDAAYYDFGANYSIDSSNTLGLSFGIRDLGDVYLTNEYGENLHSEQFYDYFLKLSYAHAFTKTISSGISFKYIKSKNTKDNLNVLTANSYAFDLGFLYRKKYCFKEHHYLYTSSGFALTNLGPRISYESPDKEFIPSKLGLGLFINPDFKLSEKVRLNVELGYQAEKYLVPTPPQYDMDGNIISGYDSDITSFKALYQSFYDAPEGFSEEINEIIHKFGSELRMNYKDKYYIAFRHGRQLEHETKGNRSYQTFGYGIGAYGFMLDFMNIKAENNSLLDNTWAISFGFKVLIKYYCTLKIN